MSRDLVGWSLEGKPHLARTEGKETERAFHLRRPGAGRGGLVYASYVVSVVLCSFLQVALRLCSGTEERDGSGQFPCPWRVLSMNAASPGYGLK